MALEYCDALTFVQALAPTWRKTQQVILAQVIQALQERPSLCPTDIARSLPPGPHASPQRPLHGRLKRLGRFLANPRLDEAAIFVRWLRLTWRFCADLPEPPPGAPILPLLLDTTYFEPFAALVVSVPCGSRGLPIAFTTYHRQTLEACFPPQKTWPTYESSVCPPAAGKQRQVAPASSVVQPWWSQNLLEEHLLDYVWSFLCPALRTVLVADRGFARAALFQHLLAQQREFVIRFDAETWLTLPDGTAGAAKEVLALQPGQRRWLPQAYYGKEERVPIAVLAVWDPGQQEPWYLASCLPDPGTVEVLYRWRMRIECGNRDEKTGVILREGGDEHRLLAVRHLHRLLLANFCTQWLAALTGLQAYHDLPLNAKAKADNALASSPLAPASSSAAATPAPTPLEQALPNTEDMELLAQGPAQPPPVIPHRGPTPPLPAWMRRFAVRGHLSYVRLGMEILRALDLGSLVRRAVRWLAIYAWTWRPMWRPWQIRYRLKNWWPLPT